MSELARRGYRQAERVTRARAKSFAFASMALGTRQREYAFSVYAFCRRCDDAVDDAKGKSQEELAARLGELREQVEAAYAGEDCGDAILAAFGDTARACAVPRRAVLGLLDGMERDLQSSRCETWDDLLEYCELAAGTVGRMMAAVLGVASEGALEHASALGRAMQLTNVMRDVREDWVEHSRVYLPRSELARYGVTDAHFASWSRARRLDESAEADGFREVMRACDEEAKRLYAHADAGVPAIVTASGRACVRLMRATYSEILHVLSARRYDAFAGRASTSALVKARVGAKALFGAAA